jgi:hypothetical protein
MTENGMEMRWSGANMLSRTVFWIFYYRQLQMNEGGKIHEIEQEFQPARVNRDHSYTHSLPVHVQQSGNTRRRRPFGPVQVRFNR